MYSYVQEKNNTIIMVFPDTEYEIIQFYEDLKNHKGFRECKKLHLFFPNVWSVKELLMLRCVLPTTKIIVHMYPGSGMCICSPTAKIDPKRVLTADYILSLDSESDRYLSAIRLYPKIIFDTNSKISFTFKNSKFEKIYYMDNRKLKMDKVDKRTGDYENIH